MNTKIQTLAKDYNHITSYNCEKIGYNSDVWSKILKNIFILAIFASISSSNY